jgi:peptide deformylase
MRKLRLRYLGDPILRKKARRLEKVTASTRETVEGMWEILYELKGIGLAAPQVGLCQRIILVDTREPGEKAALINPEITWVGEELTPLNEGCLSIPGVEGEVYRPSSIKVSGLSPEGKLVKIEAKGLFAKVFQHEIDHLNGVLFIDRISPSELARLKSALSKFEACAPA